MKYDFIAQYLVEKYTAADYPVIRAQAADFARRRPFAGVRILEATPLFFNTSAKILPLMAGGAEITLSLIPGVPRDERFIQWISSNGIATTCTPDDSFDLISDCIGLHSKLHPHIGYAELTHSGISHYEHCTKPCFNSDGGRIKRIEGALGTGDGLIRGLKHFELDVGPGQRWLLFGFGKIGSGVGIRLKATGATVTVVEASANRKLLHGTPVGDFDWVDMTDVRSVSRAAQTATHIVTATSVPGVIGRNYPVDAFRTGQILINIGAEDEYGPEFQSDEVVNGKVAVNFALEEPTHLRYIETTFALQNAGLEWLIGHPDAHGIVTPPDTLEEQLLDIVRKEGSIGPELKLIGL